ncbi:hypothetical protein [Natronorubrum daqingense]|uniref:Uncharacterized protein n=1 Tax=Natronorubrum daqingense TaxID=588898 RepID=A0A1P8RIY3_9EURY|nr:hypothetical protein [Natronorubrum daqingense]APX98616.1 hypothetical protein BB347_18145 [Natronorubrum daqingense]
MIDWLRGVALKAVALALSLVLLVALPVEKLLGLSSEPDGIQTLDADHDGLIEEFEADESSHVEAVFSDGRTTVYAVDGDFPEPIDGPTRPLPHVEIHRPRADRGADDVRDHLDGQRCIFCDVPVGDDERSIAADKFGLRVTRPICKGHSEHPESWRAAVAHNPDAMGYCPTCGDVTTQDGFRDQCSTCDPVELETLDDRRL